MSDVRSEKTEVTLRSKTMHLDFAGSGEVERDGNAVRLTGLRLVAELPDAGGPEDGGTVVLEQAGDSAQVGGEVAVPLAAVVEQPGASVRLRTLEDVRWTAGAGGDLEPADDEVGFVLVEAPESTVLTVRGLALRTGSS
ncbi:hypothetical protein SAMN05216188_12692 [Lentzea xinjiangensis]|uniref:Uncharacterized protein n=1 Tax=Lentzea xinjiangensis TaxID=402600 RepID=A0A1H9VJ01_9PSEU|nr:hypothetical protein [Lentzea xinjiangensis]SES21471.1 hypothetical protein SAMN05216188_12692 [Lentzea xinjiangensis]